MEIWLFLPLLIEAILSLYSLEKLIEWKSVNRVCSLFADGFDTLYSLEKLIEWKCIQSREVGKTSLYSLLAREIN